jgi:N-acyl-phosphatidylethanolamine-hydrolysing phospholipase D
VSGPLSRVLVGLPFLGRRALASLAPRPGAAPFVGFDEAAMLGTPSLTWIGHATMLARMDGVSFLTDPVFSERASPLPFAGPKRLVPPGVPFAALPRLDFVLLSHDHYDHTDLPTIRRLAALRVPFVAPSGMRDLIEGAGGRAIELAWWDTTEVEGVRITCVPAKHFSGRSLTDRNRRLWAGFVVEGATRRFYFAGDTASFGGFAEIGRRLGPPHLAAIPIGAYLPRRLMAAIHVTPEEAVEAALDSGAERFVGMHFGTFDLADEPLDEPPRRFLAEAARRGLGDRAFVMKIGETARM